MNILTYLIEDTNTGLIKIGKSENPIARRSALQCGSSNPLSLVKTFDANIERILHVTFRHKNVHGEWFSVDKEEVCNFVDTLDLSMYQDKGRLMSKKDAMEAFNKVKNKYFPTNEQEETHDFDVPFYELPSYTDMGIRKEYNMIYMIIFDYPPETLRLINRISDYDSIRNILSNKLLSILKDLEVANTALIINKEGIKERKVKLRNMFNMIVDNEALKEISELTTA